MKRTFGGLFSKKGEAGADGMSSFQELLSEILQRNSSFFLILEISLHFLCYTWISARIPKLPFMATENIMMDAVKAGGDRQELHEKIRELSMEAAKNVKERGLDNNLLQLIAEDPSFGLDADGLRETMDPSKYVGRAPMQVDAFLKDIVDPALRRTLLPG